MEQKEFIEGNNYQNKNKNKVIPIILIIGILIGAIFIFIGIVKYKEVNLKYTEEYKKELRIKLEKAKEPILQKQEEQKEVIINYKKILEDRIKPVEEQINTLKQVPFKGYNVEYYERNKKIRDLESTISEDKKNIEIIDKALNENFNHCVYEEVKTSDYTIKYCEVVTELVAKNNEINNIHYKYSEYNKQFQIKRYISFYILGLLSIAISISLSSIIYLLRKRQEILSRNMAQ